MPDDLEAKLRKMADDPEAPVHIQLGALKQLVASGGRRSPPRTAEES